MEMEMEVVHCGHCAERSEHGLCGRDAGARAVPDVTCDDRAQAIAEGARSMIYECSLLQDTMCGDLDAVWGPFLMHRLYDTPQSQHSHRTITITALSHHCHSTVTALSQHSHRG